jgi:hypothetical protein
VSPKNSGSENRFYLTTISKSHVKHQVKQHFLNGLMIVTFWINHLAKIAC